MIIYPFKILLESADGQNVIAVCNTGNEAIRIRRIEVDSTKPTDVVIGVAQTEFKTIPTDVSFNMVNARIGEPIDMEVSVVANPDLAGEVFALKYAHLGEEVRTDAVRDGDAIVLNPGYCIVVSGRPYDANTYLNINVVIDKKKNAI